MKNSFVLAAVVCLASLVQAQSFSCPAGTEDILNYFTMGYPVRLDTYMGPGNANPIYTSIVPDLGYAFAGSGYFLWVKSSVGYPWDIKGFDEQYVYDRTTELSWSDPTTFKRFNQDLPISRRCVPVDSAGATIAVDTSDTDYSSFANCRVTKTQNLGYVLNTMSGPITVDTGGNRGSVKTRYFKYNYSCDSNYQNCQYQEVFSLGYHMGLYDWKYYQLKNGKLKLVQESEINNAQSGAATPYTPCEQSYEQR